MGEARSRRRRRAPLLIVLGATTLAAAAAVRHVRGAATGRREPGGILIADASVYDAITGWALGPLFSHVAEDTAAHAPDGAKVLEVGCGPGHLSLRLAERYGLDVTGLDLDPAMIERARIKADRAQQRTHPVFVVGDVASLGFDDATFDIVVSTLSMHHWADPTTALREIARVLRPEGRALIWDLRPGTITFHAQIPDPADLVMDPTLEIADTSPWRWPWRFRILQRTELVRRGPQRERTQPA